jgi:Flp pilus assembly protein TadG
MSILAKAGSLLKRFRRAQEGQVALTFGLAAIPMFMLAGGTVDFMHSSAVQTRLQYALDAAALAAASSKSMSDKDRIKLAQNVFEQNWDVSNGENDLAAQAKFKVKDNTVKGEASVAMPAAFLRLAGINTLDIGSDVSISIPKGKKAEVVLVLDYSSSMTETSGGEVKYLAMKNAAKRLVSDLSKREPGQVKVGLVPFAGLVRVTLPNKFVVGQAGPGNWTGCTQDRGHPYNTKDDTPDVGKDISKWNQPIPAVSAADCQPYQSRSLNVRPLTNDLKAVNQQLDAMVPHFGTHIALGAEFGWHLLSPNEPFGEGASYSDNGTQKIIIVLSDGEPTKKAFGANGSYNEENGKKNLPIICTGAKKSGIRIMTIAFDLKDAPEARARMKSCASDPDKDHYEPETGDDVAKVFEDINTQIASQVFISD